MHRVRQSLPYFESYGWKPTVLTVFPEHVEMAKDKNLEKSIPNNIEIYMVSAYSTKYTRKLGLGNLGIRAFWQLYKKGNRLLKDDLFDLVYFSTTVFASMPLGRLWKRKFKVPFVIDMQDPWRNDYYLTVPKSKQPPKFWFAYRLNKYLEAFTIPQVDGLISVSEGYIDMLKARYPSINNIPYKVLTFGATVKDFELLPSLEIKLSIPLKSDQINLVYVGRGGHDMQKSLSLIFKTFKRGLEVNPIFQKCKFWFVGTSYALDGQGIKTIEPIAKNFDVLEYVEEITDRKPYFEVLTLLKASDILIIPGSDDKNYTASKLYPNILAKKPMLCVFHSNSSVVEIVQDLNVGEVVLFDKENADDKCMSVFNEILKALPFVPKTNWEKFEPFTAEAMTEQQCLFFNRTIKNSSKNFK
jgi:glycosyltransferase involved in cell wall biosynthesis